MIERALRGLLARLRSAPDRPALVGSGLVAALLYLLWRQPLFTDDVPALWVVATGLLALVLLRRRVGGLVLAYFLAGAATLAWSLAPGHTLVALLWEALFVAAYAAGRARALLWGVHALLLLYGADRTLLLYHFGLHVFISGGILYVAGAQALAFLPLLYAGLARARRAWARAALLVPLVLAFYLALASGSRAVYLPLALLGLLALVRVWREAGSWRPAVWPVAVVLLGCTMLDLALPSAPVRTALLRKGSVEATTRVVEDQGVLSHRLRFWDQTLSMAVDRPLGIGAGGYGPVVHAYQKHPMAWSNSPHNVFVETAATGGWLRLLLLLALLGRAFVAAWRSPRWPYALSLLGLWTFLSFDVASYYPAFMMLAFMTAGAAAPPAPAEPSAPAGPPARRGRWRAAGALLVVALGAGMAAWWYAPCRGDACLTDRRLAMPDEVLPALDDMTPERREEVLAAARRLYPASLWVVRAEQRYAGTPERRLDLAREVARRFPYQHPQNYLDWAEAALAVGDEAEAVRAVEAGLTVFPEDRYPYGEMRMTPERYAAWIEEARAILADARR